MVPTEDEYNKLSANYQSFLSNIVDVLWELLKNEKENDIDGDVKKSVPLF
jgi:hypothetical protein